jgi:regulatory protein
MYVKHALYRGRVVTQEYLDEVRREEDFFQAKQVAMRFLSRRMKSVQEVERKLAEKGVEPEMITKTIAFLREYRMVDDEEYARAFVNDQLLRRPVGRRKLEMELRRKGVAKESTNETLAEMVDDANELANAMAAAEKKALILRNDDPHKWDRSMASFLATRGFSWDVVSKVLEHFRRQRREA